MVDVLFPVMNDGASKRRRKKGDGEGADKPSRAERLASLFGESTGGAATTGGPPAAAKRKFAMS